jgi:hypothetical protein
VGLSAIANEAACTTDRLHRDCVEPEALFVPSALPDGFHQLIGGVMLSIQKILVPAVFTDTSQHVVHQAATAK